MIKSKPNTQKNIISIVAIITICFVFFAENTNADEASNKAMALKCQDKASAKIYAPWGDPQLDTFCQQAAFDKCLADNGITAYEKERVLACNAMKSSANALGVNSDLCSSSCD